MSTFVSVGNAHQPFSRLLNIVSANLHSLPQPVVVQHGHTPYSDSRCIARSFLEMLEFDNLIAEAELVILHAGGGGILQALKFGKVPVIATRRFEFGEHIDDHQVTWGRTLAATQRVVLLDPFEALAAAAREAAVRQAGIKMKPKNIPLIRLVRDALLKSHE